MLFNVIRKIFSARQNPENCPICGEASGLLGSVDFNKSCEDRPEPILPRSGKPINYHYCMHCDFCFAPEIANWKPEEFAKRIYNDDYIKVDPEYLDKRPRSNAETLKKMFPGLPSGIRHLDYGGGNGLLSDLLKGTGWESHSYDPFSSPAAEPAAGIQYDLITVFEVFEHVPDPKALLADLSKLLSQDGVILFSTCLSDGQIFHGQPLDWWYAAPRNGHISLYSRHTLKKLGKDSGLRFASFSEIFHCYWRQTPAWAAHVLPPRNQRSV